MFLFEAAPSLQYESATLPRYCVPCIYTSLVAAPSQKWYTVYVTVGVQLLWQLVTVDE